MNASFIQTVVKTTVRVTAIAALLSVSAYSSAASQCKGLDDAACASAEACGWVDSYTRKDGRQVKAFCRTSSKGKAKKVAKADIKKPKTVAKTN